MPKPVQDHERNDQPHARLSQRIKRKPGTDTIQIGKGLPRPGKDEGIAGSMKDVRKRVAGIRYLVRDWIPFAMPTMLVAEPGIGKSAFALYGLARPIILGTNWFNGMRGPTKPGYVLWCDTEGTAAITIQRIKDWKIPAYRIKVPFKDDPLRAITLTSNEDLEQIERVICRYKIKLAVIDSLRGAHDGDENNSRVAQVLRSLGEIAERTGAAVLIVHHTRKINVDEEISANSSRGSNAILAMVRSQIGIDRPDKDSDWARLQMLKENLGLRPRPIGFRIDSKGLKFGPAPQTPRRETQRDRAVDWLRDHMESGKWYSAHELLEEAKQFGFSNNTIQRARESLGIVQPSHLKKVGKVWKWKCP